MLSNFILADTPSNSLEWMFFLAKKYAKDVLDKGLSDKYLK